MPTYNESTNEQEKGLKQQLTELWDLTPGQRAFKEKYPETFKRVQTRKAKKIIMPIVMKKVLKDLDE